MNRNDEFMELKQELEQTPVELEYTAVKAIATAKRNKRRSILWKTPAVSFCCTVILFVLLVNMFPKVALAMSNVPILKDLVVAVAFDPSLKAAVEHDYYQYIGESQTQDDVTVSVEYMIVDPGHISLFFKVDAPVKSGLYHYNMRDPQGNGLVASLVYDTMYTSGELEEIQIDFTDPSYTIPEEFTFNVTINKDPDFQEQMTAILPSDADPVSLTPLPQEKSSGVDYNFTFLLKPDSGYLKAVDTVYLKQWLEIKGQRIYLDRLEIYPTRTRLFVDCDENNNAVLNNLGVYFVDENGDSYDTKTNGISGTGTVDSFDIGSIYFESSYFSDAKKLTMYIKDISLIEKEQLYGLIDYTNKSITNLPGGVSINSMELIDECLTLGLKIDTGDPNIHPQIISSEYYDNDNNKYYFSGWTGSSALDDPCYYTEYKIDNFEDNKYKLRWIYSPSQTLEKPLEISIK